MYKSKQSHLHTNDGAGVQSESATQESYDKVTYPYTRRWFPLVGPPSASSSSTIGFDSSSTSSTASPDSVFSFTLASYNMLAQTLVRRDLFKYCSKNALKVGVRQELLLAELTALETDILCAQEVDRNLYDSWWTPKLGALGYASSWGSRPDGKHGCAIFYKSNKFELFASRVIQFPELIAHPYEAEPDNQHEDPQVRKGSVYAEMNRPNIAQIVGLKVKQSPSSASASAPAPSSSSSSDDLGLFVTNTHLFWDPRYRFVRLKQCQTLLDELATLQAETNHTTYPSVMAGDWNVTPDNIIYQYLTGRSALEQNSNEWKKFLTPAEHGAPRGDDNSSSTLNLASLKISKNDTPAADASSNASASSSTNSLPTPPVNTWTPISNAPIHQIRSHMVRQSDGSMKEGLLEQLVNDESPASQRRLAEVATVLQHSRDLPLLRSVYDTYDTLVPPSVLSHIRASQSLPYCRWTGEPPFTNYTDKFKGTLDYIFLPVTNPSETCNPTPHPWRRILSDQRYTLEPSHVLETPSERFVSTATALPNDQVASDHVPIAARFTIRRKETTDTTGVTIPAGASASSLNVSVKSGVEALARKIAASLSPRPLATTVDPSSSSSSASSTSPSSPSSNPACQPFAVERFKSLLRTAHCGRTFHYVPTTSSTMDLCKSALFDSAHESNRPHSGTLWLADEQTKGRGRVEGRQWNSSACANLYFTLLIQFHGLPWEQQWKELIKLNQSTCIAVARAVERTLLTSLGLSSSDSLPHHLQPKIKWPNDIWVNHMKLSGMLIDSEIMGKDVSILIGVGINVFENLRSHLDTSLRQSATSVSQSLSDHQRSLAVMKSSSSSSLPSPFVPPTREQLLAEFLEEFEQCARKTFEEIRNDYRRYDLLLGQTITVMPKKREDTSSYYEAKAVGYSENGHLVIQLADGRREELIAEEVTIRPTQKH